MADELYLHPHVASTIQDDSIKYATAQGLTNLFACTFTAKGKDNIIQEVDDWNDFLDKYGDCYSSEFGQGNLNIKQWLQAGGMASVMRLLPEDAKLAHAILDFQVKQFDSQQYFVGDKPVTRQINAETLQPEMVLPDGTVCSTEEEVLAAGAEVKTIKRTVLRPRVKRVPGGAVSTDNISAYMTNITGLRGEDGYLHYPIGYFYPDSRGQGYYNSLRVEFTLNTGLENTYPFRVYNLSFLLEDADGNFGSADASTYLVSFDPEAVDKSEESMFIVDVLRRYAKEMSFEFNQSAWEDLCKLINPDVDPGELDLLFLQEKDNLGVKTSYHTNDCVASGMTSVVGELAPGQHTSMEVADPSVLSVDAKVIIDGIYTAEVQNVNMTTGVVTFKEALTVVGDPVEDQDPVEQIPDEEYQQTAVTNELDGSSTTSLTVLQVENANGVRKVVKGPAVLILNGNKFADVVIEEVDEATNTVTLAEAVTLPQTATGGGAGATGGATNPDLGGGTGNTGAGEGSSSGGGTSLDDTETGEVFFLRQYADASTDGSEYQDFDNYVALGGGSDGSLRLANGTLNPTVKNNLLVRGYTGQINDLVLDKERYPFDVVIDANYAREVKDALNKLASVIRKDLVAVIDLGFTGNPDQAISYRRQLGYSTFYTSLWSQDCYVQDESEGRWQKVTMTYFVAGKIPANDITYGLHWTFVGPRRGVIDSFEKLSWAPNAQNQERLYKNQINYTRVTQSRTMLYGNLTSQTIMSALSDINHVRTLLRIQREVEALFEDYIFEFLDDTTLSAMNYALQEYMVKWTNNRALQSFTASVTASDYDRKMKIARVQIEYYFTAVLERIFITHIVKG